MNNDIDLQLKELFTPEQISEAKKRNSSHWNELSLNVRAEKILQIENQRKKQKREEPPKKISPDLFLGRVKSVSNGWGRLQIANSSETVFFSFQDCFGVPKVGEKCRFLLITPKSKDNGNLVAKEVVPVHDKSKSKSNPSRVNIVNNAMIPDIVPNFVKFPCISSPPNFDPRFQNRDSASKFLQEYKSLSSSNAKIPTEFNSRIGNARHDQMQLSKSREREMEAPPEKHPQFPPRHSPSNQMEEEIKPISISNSASITFPSRSPSPSPDSHRRMAKWKADEDIEAGDLDEQKWHRGVISTVPSKSLPGFIKVENSDRRQVPYDLTATSGVVLPAGSVVRFRVVADDTWNQRISKMQETIIPILHPEQPFAGIIDDYGLQKMATFFGRPVFDAQPRNVGSFLTPEGLTKHDSSYMIQKSKIDVDETREYEFKLYTTSKRFENIRKDIEKYACAFLNDAKGGTIFFGIHDSKVVYGVHVPDKSRDELRHDVIDSIFHSFIPNVDTNHYELDFVPLLNDQGYRIRDMFVIKLTVHADSGSRAPAYSTRDKIFWIRRDGSVRPMGHDMVNARVQAVKTKKKKEAEANALQDGKVEREIVLKMVEDYGCEKGGVLSVVFDLKQKLQRMPKHEEVVDKYFAKSKEQINHSRPSDSEEDFSL